MDNQYRQIIKPHLKQQVKNISQPVGNNCVYQRENQPNLESVKEMYPLSDAAVIVI